MITSKSNQHNKNNNKNKTLMFLSENREINAYLNNYLANVNRTGDQESNNNIIGLNTVLKGFCEVKTQFSNEVNSDNNKLKLRYVIVRENTVNPSQRKIFVEFYKDEGLAKLKFIIDTDLIEQIDFKEKDNSIYLKRSETREKCQLKYDDKRVLQKWLNTLCRYCGFNEVQGSQASSLVGATHQNHRHPHPHQQQQQHNYTNIDQTEQHLSTKNKSKSKSNLNLVTTSENPNQTNQNSSSSSTASNKITTTSSSTHGNLLSNLIKTASVASSRSTRNEPVPASKNIAGEAASSVGSFDLCKLSELNTLFHNQHENGGGSNSGGETATKNDNGYLQLGEFVSRGNLATSKSSSSSSSNYKSSDAISNRTEVNNGASSSNEDKVVFQKNTKKTNMGNNVYTNVGAIDYLYDPNEDEHPETATSKTTSKNDDYYLNKSLKYVPLEVITIPTTNDSESLDLNNNHSTTHTHHHSSRLAPDDLDPSVRSAATAHKRLSNVSTAKKEKKNLEQDSFYTHLEAARTKALKKTIANVNKPQ